MTTCSNSSITADEQLFATAARADFWFLLEHPATYGANALAESGLSEDVIRHLEAAAASVSNGRIQLIKRSNARKERPLSFFVVVNHEEQPNLYEFELEKVEDLLALDLVAIAREELAYRKHDRTEPIFLVCTNGRRDPCCSSLGLPLFREMQKKFGDAAWQASHVGGHRFAPSIVVLPSGANYGYVSPSSLDLIVAASRAGKVHLANYRGRSCYSKHVQAADTFLRRHCEHSNLLQYKLVEVEKPGEYRWMLHFADRHENKTYCVQVRSQPAAVSVQKSCRDPEKSLISQFILEELRIY